MMSSQAVSKEELFQRVRKKMQENKELSFTELSEAIDSLGVNEASPVVKKILSEIARHLEDLNWDSLGEDL
jgi:hypothetical protein